jgi:DNA-binding phage protein
MVFNTSAFRNELLKEKGEQSYPKFAKEVGINEDTLYSIMKKGGTPNLCTLYKLLTHFGWDIKQFETDKNK